MATAAAGTANTTPRSGFPIPFFFLASEQHFQLCSANDRVSIVLVVLRKNKNTSGLLDISDLDRFCIRDYTITLPSFLCMADKCSLLKYHYPVWHIKKVTNGFSCKLLQAVRQQLMAEPRKPFIHNFILLVLISVLYLQTHNLIN